ncbi:MAG: hypothetical protein AB8H86_05640 [Polyangiales bacterium]
MGNDGDKKRAHRTVRVSREWALAGLLLSASLSGCGGEEAEAPTPSAESAPAEAPVADEPVAEEPAAEEPALQEEPSAPEEEVAEAEPEGAPVVVPGYAAAPPACEANPDSAPAEPISLRALSRGEPDFPMAVSVNATCEHDPAELAVKFNEGGLREHRRRDYVQSQHYFSEALVLDPSQLSARFNLACAMARQGMIDEAILQLLELEKAGPEGVEYAGRAQRDRDFGEFHNTPALAALIRGIPPAIEAIRGEDTRVSEGEPGEAEDQDTLFFVEGEKVWENGVLPSDDFQGFVLTMESSRRRFRFFNDRPSEGVQAALEAIGLKAMLRHAGWTPSMGDHYLIVPVSSRDEDRHTLYLARILETGALAPLESPDLPAATCDEGVEVVRTFVESEDHRTFGYVTGCLGEAPWSFERCLYHYDEDQGVVRRCGHGEAPAEEAPVAEEGEPTAVSAEP